METERSNLPADLPTLAREIDAALARDAEFEDEYRNREAALWQEFVHQRSCLVQDIDQRRLPYRIELGQLLNTARAQFAKARDFDRWVREKTKVSRTVAYECMKLARADDPETADAERRAGQAKRKRELRAGSSGTVSVPDGSSLEPREPITYVPPAPLPAEILDEPRSEAPATCPMPADTVFDLAKRMAAERGGRRGPAETRWWRIPELLDATPTTPEEAEIQYNALGWLEEEVAEPLLRNRQAQGDKLKEARKLFPTRKAWEGWVKSLKTCPASTWAVNAALFMSTAARAKRADRKVARVERLRREFPELATLLDRGDNDALELVHATMDVWEEAANKRGGTLDGAAQAEAA